MARQQVRDEMDDSQQSAMAAYCDTGKELSVKRACQRMLHCLRQVRARRELLNSARRSVRGILNGCQTAIAEELYLLPKTIIAPSIARLIRFDT